MKVNEYEIIDRAAGNNGTYQLKIQADNADKAIKYFFKMEGIKATPVRPKYQGLKEEDDARYSVINKRTKIVSIFNADGEAYSSKEKMVYNVDTVNKEPVLKRA